MSEREVDSASVPTYIAQCPECDGLVACHVADVSKPSLMKDAARAAMKWQRDGYRVSTVTVGDVRTWPSGKAFTHGDGCSRDRRKSRTTRKPQAQRTMFSGEIQEASRG